jgi:hypothetical protein
MENSMKKFIITYCLFAGIVIQGMALDSPEKIILDNIEHPSQALELLEKNFSPVQLKDYRDKEYNNLMHVTIKELTKNKNTQGYVQLKDEFIPLLRHLAHSGISVNEENDNHETPYFLASKDNDNDDLVENFLESELGGKPSYFSLNPELRFLKKLLANVCCGCCKKSKQL